MPYDKSPSEVFAEELMGLMASRVDEQKIVAGMAIDAIHYDLSSNPDELMEEINDLRRGDPQAWEDLATAFEGTPAHSLILRLADQKVLGTD